MTISAPDVAVFGNTDLWLANNDGTASELRFFEDFNAAGAFPGTANYTAFKAQTQTDNITYTLPSAITGTIGDERFLRSTTTTANTAATLDWVNAATIVGGSGVLYNVSSTQATATPRNNYLFDVAYAAAAPDAASTGARITSSAGAAGNNNATALTLVATKTGTGTATALDATGNILLANTGTASELRLAEPSGSGTDYTAFKAQAQANNITYTLPAANGTAGQVLRVASTPAPTATAATLEWVSNNLGAIGGLAFARKTADEGVTSNTTLQNDDHLVVALNANETYELEGVLYVSTTANGHDLQIALTVPTSTTMKVSYNAREENTATSREADVLETSGTAGTVVNVQAANRSIVYVKGLIRTAGTSGNVTLQWADDNTSGTETVTVQTDSYFKVTRVE